MQNQQPPSLHPPQTSGMAIASLITGIVGAFPLAIIFGHIALSQIKKSSGRLSGFGLALAGTILGYVGLAVMLLLFAMSILFVGARAWKRGSDRAACILQTRNMQQAVRGHANMKALSVGDTINWNEIFGPGGYLPAEPVCPTGGTYTFSDTVPPIGTLVGQCSHPDHVPTNHSDW